MIFYLDHFTKKFSFNSIFLVLCSIFIFCSLSSNTIVVGVEKNISHQNFLKIDETTTPNSLFNSYDFDIINLTNNTSDSIYSQIDAFENNVYVVWQESISANLSELNYDIFFIKSEDDGKTFTKPVNLSNNSYFSGRPQIDVFQNNIFVVWSDKINSTKKEISFIKSEDNGKTFSKPVNLSNNSYFSSNPDISVDNNHVYVVWKDRAKSSSHESIVFKHSENMGENFNKSIYLMNNTIKSFPKVNSNDDHLYLIWNSETNSGIDSSNDLYFIKSEDNGETFNKILKIGYGNFGESQIAIDKNELIVASGGLIFANSTNFDNIYIIKSYDYGNSFSSPIKISEYLIDFENNQEVHQKLEHMINNPLNVEILNDNLSYFVWQNTISENDYDVILLNKINDGDFEILNITDEISDVSQCPSLAISNGHVYLLWESFIDGNNDIIFTTIPTK